MAPTLNLVNAVAAKRLVAGLLDAVPVVIAVMVFFGANYSTMASSAYATGPEIISEMATSYLLLAVFLLAYAIVLWGWEAQTGKTPGNLALGLRTSDEDGFAPGWGKVFIRRALVWVAGIVPVAGPVVMLLSNLWDPNHQRQGWHDKAARTLVVDVNQGRNPITTGGLFGPSAFAPGGVTQPGQQGHPDFGATGRQWPALDPRFAGDGPITGVPGASEAAPAGTHAREPEPLLPPGAAPAPPAPPAVPAAAPPGDTADADEEAGHTQLRSATRAPGGSGARLRFDDGQTMVLAGTALVGRNPAPREGEEVAELFNFADMGRSVSKTHLHLATDSAGIWVTDRNSTNGAGITGADGILRHLVPGQSQHAEFGETVHFGDRSFTVDPA